jgi:hypothetical protein
LRGRHWAVLIAIGSNDGDHGWIHNQQFLQDVVDYYGTGKHKVVHSVPGYFLSRDKAVKICCGPYDFSISIQQ